MKKRVFLLIVFLAILSSIVSAVESIEISSSNANDIILPQEFAKFKINIDNNQDFTDNFRIEKPGVYWEWLLNSDTVEIPSRKTGEIEVSLTPTDSLDPGDYGISLDVVSLKNSTVRSSKLFAVKLVSYNQALLTDLLMSDNINPNKENLFRVQVRNNYDMYISNLKLRFSSKYFDQTSEEFDIKPYETLSLEFPIIFEGVVEAGDTQVYLEFYRDDESVLKRDDTINIGYFTDVTGIGTPEDGFLHKKETIVRTNEGNTVSKENLMKRLTVLEKYFTKTSPEPNDITKGDGEYILSWTFDLNPDETQFIVINTDYRLFVLSIIIFILLVGGLYYLLRRDISLEKKVVSMKKGEDGFYTLNVVMSLKNKMLKSIRNIKIMDRLDGRIDKTFNFGTLEPRVFRGDGNKSVKLVWFIDNLGAREEIILQYSIKYKPHIIRSVPSAIAKYLRRGRAVFVKSKKIDIFS